jgi:RimJ/RimL family protein N-acetyltransferase
MPAAGQPGAQPLIRRLWPTDLAAIEAHFLRLDPATRRDRFMHAMGDEAIRAYARHAVTTDGLMFGCLIAGELRGVAELRPASARDSGLGPEAEAAFAIERPFRRGGLGTRLFRRLARAARARSVRRLKVRCLAENRAMQALARKVGSDLVLAGWESGGELSLAAPTPLALWQEGLEDGIDLTLAAAARFAETPALAA